MRPYWIIPFALLGLNGCVTETHRVTKNSPVASSSKVNNIEAAKTRITLALEYLKAGNNTQAKFNLERAAQFAPKLPEAHYTLAYFYEQVKEFEKAKNAYKTALTLVPNDPNTLNNYGTFLCRIGEYDEATDQLLKAIDIPGYLRVSQSYENLALCAVKQDKFELALEYLNSATQHDSRNKTALISLSALYYAKSDLHQALRVLERYSNSGFISSRSLFLEYLLHQEMGHLEKSQKIASTIIQAYPNSYQAQAIIKEEYNKSEFEDLREQYRKAKLAQITEHSSALYVAQPKIKITRKKARNRSASDEKESISPDIVLTSSQDDVSVDDSESVSLRNNFANPTGLVNDQVVTSTESAVSQNSMPKETSLEFNNQAAQVRVVSFGEQPINAKDESKVQFYQPNPSQVRFREVSDNSVISDTVTQSMSGAVLLNPEVSLPNVRTHIVNLGENLFSLSVKYNIKMAKLLKWNKLKESDRLQAGHKVYLNNPNLTHTIQTGDSLYTIATDYQLQMNDLMRWNKLTPDVELTSGRSLLIVDPSNYTL